VVKLEDSPTPRFDLLKLDRYVTASMQFSRGCPYPLRILRHHRHVRASTAHQKPASKLAAELDQLRAQCIHNVFFVDDNLIGNPKLAKALLRLSPRYQERHHYAFQFGTEASINLADDAELLRLFQAANFAWVFIGIESSDEDSLKETLKTQKHRPRSSDRRTPLSMPMAWTFWRGLLSGFDNDTLDSFDKQHCFITSAGIQVSMVGLLTALPRTPLYERLQQEGRLIAGAEHGDNTKPGTNIIPKHMGYEAMVQNYQALYRRLFSDHGIAQRIGNKFRYLRNPVYRGKYSLHERLAIVRSAVHARLAHWGTETHAPHFSHADRRAAARLAAGARGLDRGLAMRDYIQRHFLTDRNRSSVCSAHRRHAAQTVCGRGTSRCGRNRQPRQ